MRTETRFPVRFANHCEVGRNAIESMFDFGRFYSGSERVRFHTRIVTSPVYAKAPLEMLGESIARYEQTFGAIGGD
jgi:hypothetical protein